MHECSHARHTGNCTSVHCAVMCEQWPQLVQLWNKCVKLLSLMGFTKHPKAKHNTIVYLDVIMKLYMQYKLRL